MKLIPKPLHRWLLVFALMTGSVQVHAQDTGTVEETDAIEIESPETAGETTAESDEDKLDADISEAATNQEVNKTDSEDDDGNRRRSRNRWRRNNPYIGVLYDVAVETGDTAEIVVSILADYVIEGRSAGEAVMVLGHGEVSGPVDGDCVTVLGRVIINAPVGGDLVVVCSDAYINGPINGNVVLILSNVEFGPDARVSGETIIVGPKPIQDPGAVFEGPKFPIRLPSMTWLGDYVRSGILLGRPIAPGIPWVWFVVLSFFIFRLLLLLIFPRPVNAGVKVMQQGALRTFLIGVIAYILYVPALFLISATVVGIIAIPFVALAWEIATILGKISVLVLLGNHLGRQLKLSTMETPVGGFIVGTALVTLVYMVPVLGILVHLLIKPLALGCMLVAAIDTFQRERKPPTLPPANGGPEAAATLNTSTTPAADHSSGTDSTASAGTPPVINPPRSRAAQPSPDELATFQRVGFWPRFGASLLDFILIMILCAAVLQRGGLFPLVWIAYHIGMWSWRGTTLGGMVFSLRIVRLDGRRFDIVTAIVRFIGGALSLVVAGLGFFWASWNPEKQSWHDMIAGTIVVKTPRAVPLV